MRFSGQASLATRLGGDAAAYGVGLFASRIGSLILLPVYSHSLPVKDFGALAVLLVWMELLFILLHLGLRTVVLKYCLEPDAHTHLGELFASALALSGSATLLVFGATVLVHPWLGTLVPALGDYARYLPLICAAAFCHSTFVLLATYFRARQQPWAFMVVGVTATLLLVGTTLLFLIVLGMGILGAFLGMILTYGTLGAALGTVLWYRHPFRVLLPRMRRFLTFGSTLLPVNLSSVLTEAVVLLLLTRSVGLESTAVYSLGNRIIGIGMILFVSPLQMAFEPFIFQHSGSKTLREQLSPLLAYLLLGFLIVAGALVLFGRHIVALLAPASYSASYWPAMALLPLIGANGVYYFAEALLNARARSGTLCSIVLLFTGVSLLLAFGLVPPCGVWGAVVARVTGNVARACVLLRVALRLHSVSIRYTRHWRATAILGLGVVVLLPIQRLQGWTHYAAALVVIAAVAAATAHVLGLTNRRMAHRRLCGEGVGVTPTPDGRV